MDSLARPLIILGLVLLALGLVVYVGPSVPLLGSLGRLPGDIRIEREGFRFYFPITSCIVVSAIVYGVVWIAAKLR